MKRIPLITAAAIAVLPLVAMAEIRPSFHLEDLAFEATHVVVVTEGERIDGVVEVVEAWIGDLRPGARLELPALADFASDEARTLSTRFGPVEDGDPEMVDGSRMVLFLVKEGGSGEAAFRHASPLGGMDVSVAWLANGHAYGFSQVMNPGDPVLVRVAADDKAMRERVVAIATARRDLESIAAAPDKAERAHKAAPYTRFENHRIMTLAFETLANSGTAALPVLRAMLTDKERTAFHPLVIRALAAAGGKTVVPDLVRIVAKETEYWRATAPELERGWWNGTGLERSDVGPIRERYSLVLAALRALEELRDPACTSAVTALRDYWRSLPQLEDKSGLDQMSETCDGVLAVCDGK